MDLRMSLRMQENLFESAFKFSPIGMALVSPEGKWLKVNCALLKLLGYTETEFLKLDFLQMTHPEDLKTDLDLVKEILLGKRETYQLEKRYFHKDSSIIYALLSVTLIRNSDGTPRFFISQIQDMTELKKTQKSLQANSKMVALGEMAAGIAHEINNPLTIISLHSRALEQLVQAPELDRPMVNHFTAKINDTIKRISSIVSSLRKFSSDSSKVDSFEVTSLDSIFEDALGLCTEKFRAAGVKFTLDISPGIELECNPLDLSQVLINLINNSFFAVKDSEIKEISIAAHEIDGIVSISVMDSGPGILKEHREKVLDPFFSTKPIGQGTGLGLSISNSIVQLHDGILYLDEECERTNFVVKLPLRQDHLRRRSEAPRPANNIQTL